MGHDGYINVLSLDGGGIKGLYTARVLQHFEEVYSTQISSTFDLICGTSTGGLITLGLASGHSAKSIGDFYESKGKYIFPYTGWVTRKLNHWKSLAVISKYPATVFRREITAFFGENILMRDLKSNVCIPAYNIGTGSPVVFKKSENASYVYDRDVNVIDVALATSAAPTFFPIHEITGTIYRNGRYIDGGIWANDPSLCGLLEIIRETKPEDRLKIRIFSVSAVPTSPAIPKAVGKRYSAMRWGSNMFDFAIQSQRFQNSNLMEWLSRELNINYHRIEPEALSKEQLKHVHMDSATTKAIDLYNNLGQQSGISFLTRNRGLLNQLFNHQNP